MRIAEEDEKVGGKEAGVGTKGVAGGWRWKSELHALLKLIGSRQKVGADTPLTGTHDPLHTLEGPANLMQRVQFTRGWIIL